MSLANPRGGKSCLLRSNVYCPDPLNHGVELGLTSAIATGGGAVRPRTTPGTVGDRDIGAGRGAEEPWWAGPIGLAASLMCVSGYFGARATKSTSGRGRASRAVAVIGCSSEEREVSSDVA